VSRVGRGSGHLVAALLYGAGLRLLEGLRLRVKDVDLAGHRIVVRQGKGGTGPSHDTPGAPTR